MWGGEFDDIDYIARYNVLEEGLGCVEFTIEGCAKWVS